VNDHAAQNDYLSLQIRASKGLIAEFYDRDINSSTSGRSVAPCLFEHSVEDAKSCECHVVTARA
jgi:hypothetical protein